MNLCELCARRGKTCCQQTDVFLTANDIRRIRAHTGRLDFFERRKPRGPEYRGSEDDPRWLYYTLGPDGSRTVIRHLENEDCLFLTARGCSLPSEARPLICRLHPLTYTESGITGASSDCPADLLAGQNLLEAVGMDLEAAFHWHRQLYAELRAEPARAALARPGLRGTTPSWARSPRS